jgi:hypothetical protein
MEPIEAESLLKCGLAAGNRELLATETQKHRKKPRPGN